MHDRAGTRALPEDLINVDDVISAYYDIVPDPTDVGQRVAFGTSGHRGSSLDGKFNEAHIIAITAAIIEYRASQGINGPLFIGRDTRRPERARMAYRHGGPRGRRHRHAH